MSDHDWQAPGGGASEEWHGCRGGMPPTADAAAAAARRRTGVPAARRIAAARACRVRRRSGATRRPRYPPGRDRRPARTPPPRTDRRRPAAGPRRRSRACSPCARWASARCSGRRSAPSDAIPLPRSAAASSCSSSQQSRPPAVLVPFLAMTLARLDGATTADADAILAGAIGGFLLLMLVPVALSVVAGAFLQGVMVVDVATGTVGDRLGFGALWKRAAKRIWPLIGWTLLVAAALIVGVRTALRRRPARRRHVREPPSAS